MINIYARQAPIYNCVGRSDYISSPERQENLMAVASTYTESDFWNRLASDAQTAFRLAGGKRKRGDNETRACEAREIHLQLPNSALDKMTADQLAQKIANDFKSKYGVECQVAIHYNKTMTNLHCHILFSERILLPDPDIRIADRNAFLDADGIRKRTKKEILDADGQLLPGCSIVKKGEILSARYFGDKNVMFSEKAWMDEYRNEMAGWINENLNPDVKRTVFDRNGPYLAQKHIGKDTPDVVAAAYEQWNRMTKSFNGLIGSRITEDDALDYKTRILISPDHNQELTAVLAEIAREMMPDSQYRTGWDAAASHSAEAILDPNLENREKKQDLRDRYKLHGELSADLADAQTDDEANEIADQIMNVADDIHDLKEDLGLLPEQQMLREFGKIAGVSPKEVDRIYQAAERMTAADWKKVWAECRVAQSQFWEEYRRRREEMQKELDEAYKELKKVRNAEWLLSPRNRKASLLGVLYALVVTSRAGVSSAEIRMQIERIRNEQQELRREVARFKSATDRAHKTLHTKGLNPEKYLNSVQRMQRIADGISKTQKENEWGKLSVDEKKIAIENAIGFSLLSQMERRRLEEGQILQSIGREHREMIPKNVLDKAARFKKKYSWMPGGRNWVSELNHWKENDPRKYRQALRDGPAMEKLMEEYGGAEKFSLAVMEYMGYSAADMSAVFNRDYPDSPLLQVEEVVHHKDLSDQIDEATSESGSGRSGKNIEIDVTIS